MTQREDRYSLSSCWRDTVENVVTILAGPTLAKSWVPLWPYPGVGRSRTRQVTNDLTPLVLKMRRLLREVTGGGIDDDIVAKLKVLVASGEDFERGLVAWVALIDALLNSANCRYGEQDYQLTHREMKAVVRRLYRSKKFSMPHVPNWMEPVILDVAVSISVDVVQLIARRYGLWFAKPQKIGVLRKCLRSFWRCWVKIVTPTAAFLGGLYQWFAERYWSAIRLSPEIREAIADVEKGGFGFALDDVVEGIEETLTWLQNNRPRIVAFVELVQLAVHEAERIQQISGKEKKRYAKNLVLAVLDDMGVNTEAGLMAAVLTYAVNASIEMLVHLFNKHGVFMKSKSVAT